ncbi:hypothetical protein ACFFGV_02465 [Pontibacillus salicampi]|uniref:SPOR domain-containing protein n=1 Tax=Pontibacillus salicampi TaxID=1449801 RepID=A0ABV6LJD3_9BACI
MRDSNKVSIRINGDKHNTNPKEQEAQEEIIGGKEEQASAMEDWMEEQAKKKDKKSKPLSSKNSKKRPATLFQHSQWKKQKLTMPANMKQILMSGVSAIFVSVILGIIILRLLVGMEADTAAQQNTSLPATPPVNTSQGNAATSQPGVFSFPEVSAFVIQRGVFSEQVNAEIRQKALSSEGFSSYVWEKGGQFYLLAGVASTKEEGKAIASLLEKEGFETYVKEWSVASQNRQSASKEGDWIVDGMSEWKEMVGASARLLAGTSSESLDAKAVSVWRKEMPNEATEQTAFLSEGLANIAESGQAVPADDAMLWKMQKELLQVWHGYEAFIKPE